ncbi:MAG: Glutamine--scyllo-inositol transaminase [Paenibacillus sp.]|nr:Glutamine--scyllo-inositol transaminase [Paenibacillus sp.]
MGFGSQSFGDLEKEYVLRVLDKKRVFRFGGDQAESEAKLLEQRYKERTGAPYCLAVNSGTSAIIATLIGAGIGPGDEVIIPAYTYVATAAAVLIARAVPVIVEVDDSLTMDPQACEAAITPSTKAIMPVHMRGIPSQMDELMAIARKHSLLLIEDVAQANGSSYKGKALGTIGHAGCFSFQESKVITAGEGGMILTNDGKLFTRASMYHDTALSFWQRYEPETLGLNDANEMIPFPGEDYRMSEIHAAIALAQTERLDGFLAGLRRSKRMIVAGIRDLPQIQLQRVPDPEGEGAYQVIFYMPTVEQTKKFASLLNAEGVRSSTTNDAFPDRHIYKNWDYIMDKRPISEKDNPWTNEHYKGNVHYSRDMCPRTMDWLTRAVTIGLHPNMDEEQCRRIVAAIRKTAASFEPIKR